MAEQSEAYFYLGYIDAEQSKWAAAVQDFEDARRLRPGLSGAGSAEALLLATCPDAYIVDAARAETLAREDIRLNSQSPFEFESLGAAHAREGQFEQATTELQTAIEKDRSGPDTKSGIRFRRALALVQSRQPLTYGPEMWAR